MEPSRTSRIVSFSVLIAIILIFGGLFFKVMASFLVPMFLAVLCVIIFRPWHAWILPRCRDRHRLAAGLTTAAILLVVFLPAFSIMTLAAIEGTAVVTNLEVSTIRQRVAKLRQRLGLELPLANQVQPIDAALRSLTRTSDSTPQTATGPSRPVGTPVTPNRLLEMVEELQRHIAAEPTKYPQERLDRVVQDLERLKSESLGTPQFEDALASAFHEFNEFKTALCGGPYRLQLIEMANPSDEVLHEWRVKIATKAQSWLLAAGGATTAFVGQLVLCAFVIVVSIYFFLLDGPNITRSLMTLTPLDDRYKRELMREFDQISRAVVLATLLSAVIQGVLAFFGYWFAGLPSVFLLMLLTMVMALVPFVGATVVWLPACLWLYVYEERTWPAILLAVYCVAVVSTADNLIKPWVLRGKSKLHPLLALLSVLGGVQALGPLGILVGPMIVVFLQTLLNILHRELAGMDRAKAA